MYLPSKFHELLRTSIYCMNIHVYMHCIDQVWSYYLIFEAHLDMFIEWLQNNYTLKIIRSDFIYLYNLLLDCRHIWPAKLFYRFFFNLNFDALFHLAAWGDWSSQTAAFPYCTTIFLSNTPGYEFPARKSVLRAACDCQMAHIGGSQLLGAVCAWSHTSGRTKDTSYSGASTCNWNLMTVLHYWYELV